MKIEDVEVGMTVAIAGCSSLAEVISVQQPNLELGPKYGMVWTHVPGGLWEGGHLAEDLRAA